MTNCTHVLHFNKCCILCCKRVKYTQIGGGVGEAAPYTKEVDIVEDKQTPEFPAYYTVLCAHVANAIDAMEQHNYGAAKELLITGMQNAEEIILSQKE